MGTTSILTPLMPHVFHVVKGLFSEPGLFQQLSMSDWDDKEKTANVAAQPASESEETIVHGDVKYTAAEGLNSTSVTFQDASGAPVETSSPLGYSVSYLAAMCLNINQMIGTGIFSTRQWPLDTSGFNVLTRPSGFYSRRRWLGRPYHDILVHRIPFIPKHVIAVP